MHGAAALGSGVGLSRLGVGSAFAAEPAKPAELVVRAWGGVWVDALKAGVSDPFSAMTGIPIRHDLTEDNEIQPKIWAAVDQGRLPPININWDTTINATKSALRGVTEDLSDVPNLANTLAVAKPEGLTGVPIVNVYAYVYVLAYREEAFPDGPPTTWNVLLDPKFKGRVALYNDGIGLHAPAEIAGGGSFSDIPGNMQPAWDFFTKLKEQKPLLGEDPDFTTWFQNGEIDVACTISSNAREAKNNGIPVKWTVPQEGATLDTDCLWIPKGLPEGDLYWAKQYINYAISPEGQQAWLTPLGLPGVVPGLTPPDDLKGDLSYPTSAEDLSKLLQVSPKIQVENQSDWFAKFKEIMQS
jgi:putative spermidine/putrescine transport system substrate-binding protein